MGYAENSALASQMIVFETYKGYSIYWGMKVKIDHRSKFSNLSNWKEEA